MNVKAITLNNLYKLDVTDAKATATNSSGKKTLLVDLEVSASAKVINSRIYPPAGQKNMIHSWTKPRPKPVILDHNDAVENTIGRFVSAEYQDLEQEALLFLRGDIRALTEIKRAFATNDAKQIYSLFKKYNLFDKRWPGLGRIIGKVRISDQDAVEKFLDGRYDTVSAGQGTDAWTCMICGAEWHKGNTCEHPFGGIDEDGNPIIYLCGNMSGKEVSVVNSPASDTSYTLKMEVADDDANTVSIVLDNLASDLHSTISVEKQMNFKDLQALEIPTVIAHLTDEANFKEFQDAITGDTQYEISWLIRVHDALHSQWDFNLKYPSSDMQQMPMAVYALHGAIHDSSMEKGFRDSLMNGYLDNYDSAGQESVEYQYAQEDKTSNIVLTDAQTTQIMSALLERIAAATPKEELAVEATDATKEGTDGHEEKEEEVKDTEVLDQVTDELDLVDDTEIDWGTLDLALEALVGDAKLSTEKRTALKGSSFCGPGRTFPVPDCAHVTAARRLIGRSKLSQDQKSKVLACVSRKAKSLGCDGKDSTDCDCHKPCEACAGKDEKISQLTSDFAESINVQNQLKDQLLSSLKTLSISVRPEVDIKDIQLDTLLDWVKTLSDNQVDSSKAEESPKQLKAVGDPGVVKYDHTQSAKELTTFEKQTISHYESILKKDGKDKADGWLATQRSFLPRNFKISTVDKE